MLKHRLSIFILLCLLIVGCSGQNQQPADAPATTPPQPTAGPTKTPPDPSPTEEMTPSQQETARLNRADIATFIERAATFGYSGMALVAHEGAVIESSGHGLANRTTGHVPTDQTMFDIGSVTKLFTAVAILQLESAGLLSLDDPISSYLPDVPPDKAAITIHHLMSHSAGFRPHHSDSDFDPMTKEEALAEIMAQELLFPPGEISEYSNSGYTLLAAIIEAVTGETYQDYMQNHLFDPAGMDSSGFYGDPRWSEDSVAQAYIGQESFGSPLTWAGPHWGLIGNGGMVSNITDLYRWHLALQGDDILDEAARTKLWEPQLPLNDEGTVFEAYGWIIVDMPDVGRIGLLSGGDGFDAMNAHYRYYRDQDLTIITLTNDGDFPGELLARSLGRFALGQTDVLPPAVTTISPNLLNLYQGTYSLPSGDRIVVQNSDPALLVSGLGQQAVNLLTDNVPEPDGALLAYSAELIEAIDAGDFEALYEAYNGELQLSGIENYFGNLWEALERERGSLVSATPIGLTFTPFGDLAASVEVQFSQGEPSIFNLYWFDGVLQGLEIDVELPGTTRFLPTADTIFVAYDFFSGDSRTLHFNIEDGRIVSLTFSTPDGEITAEKLQG